MGTAQQDSERRDFTINALYYNIHTNLVEDLVGGLRDLEQKIIRTPLSPMTTFSDDPLRILRAARFAGRYYIYSFPFILIPSLPFMFQICYRFGYAVHPDIERAAVDPSIQVFMQLIWVVINSSIIFN
jgi:hypothetical protein